MARSASPVFEQTLSIGADPNPISFGQTTAISGMLKGAPSGGQAITLQANPAPFAAGFQDIGTTTTGADGKYVFKDVKPALNTRYRTVTGTSCIGPVACCLTEAADGSAVIPCCAYPVASRSTARIICPLGVAPCPPAAAAIPDPCSPTITSRELLVKVRVRVVLHVGDATPHAGERTRFYGTVAPAHDSQPIYIQRQRRNGKWRTVKTAVLQDAANEVSTFSTKVRVKHVGIYRARIHHDTDHAGGKSKRRRVSGR